MTPVRNLLLFLCHGLRSDAVSDEHRWPLTTPHLRDLAHRGLRVVASSASPCDPSGRVSLLTGLHARQHGWLGCDLPMPSVHGSIPLWLKQAGYRVAGVGQVSAFEDVLDHAVVTRGEAASAGHGRDRACRYLAEVGACGLADAVVKQRRQARRHGPWAVDRLLLEPDQDIDGYIAAEAERMVHGLDDDRPWAVIVAFSGPGNALPPPPMYAELADASELAFDFVPAKATSIDTLADPTVPRARLQNLTRAAVGRLRADYLGRVALVDFGIGRVQRAAQARADANRTWTVVASDRGTLLGEHGLIGDRSFLSETLETPLIVAGPEGGAAPKSHYLDALVSTVDVAPTVARLGQCDVPQGLPGRSLVDAFGDALHRRGHGGPPAHPCNLAELPDRLMLETERHKLILAMPDGRPLALFDLLHDPGERRNLLELPRQHEVLGPLRQRLAEALLPMRAAAF